MLEPEVEVEVITEILELELDDLVSIDEADEEAEEETGGISPVRMSSPPREEEVGAVAGVVALGAGVGVVGAVELAASLLPPIGGNTNPPPLP